MLLVSMLETWGVNNGVPRAKEAEEERNDERNA